MAYFASKCILLCICLFIIAVKAKSTHVYSTGIANQALFKIRGGARVNVKRRKKKKLGMSVMISSFIKSMFDPTFGTHPCALVNPQYH